MTARSAGAERRTAGDPQRASVAPPPSTDDLQIRILDRMVGVLKVLVESQEHGGVAADDLGLMTLMTQDLDRHLTALMDARYEPADDAHVLAIEQALTDVRVRLGEWTTAEA